MEDILKHYRNWQYKNTTLLILSIILLVIYADSHFVRELIDRIGGLGYVGAFITGIFFVSIFTVAPSTLVLYDLADKLDPLWVAAAAGAGAVIGDFLIFRFFER